jgi:hypothetical protein
MNLLYVKIMAGGLLLLSIFYAGWHIRDVDFMAFKREVEHTAKVQEAQVESIKKQQTLVTKGIANEYDAKLAAVRNYYKSTSVWNNPSSGKVSGLSPSAKPVDAVSPYNILAGQCAETTQQLVSLQEWINGQIGVK